MAGGNILIYKLKLICVVVSKLASSLIHLAWKFIVYFNEPPQVNLPFTYVGDGSVQSCVIGKKL